MNPHATLDEQQLAAVNEIARIASGELEPRPMLDRITQAIRVRFGWEFITFVSIDAEQRRFTCEAVHAPQPAAIQVGYSGALDSGMVGEVVAGGKAVVYDDVRTARHYHETVPGMRSAICLPVMYRGRLIAVLDIESRQPAAFREHLPLLETIADQVAGAIEGARLYLALAQHARLMETLSQLSRLATQSVDLDTLLRQSTDYIAAQLGIAVVSIMLLDDTGQYFIIETLSGRLTLDLPGGGNWPVTVGVCGRCARTGEPQLVYADAHDPEYVVGHPDVRAEYIVPIRYHGRVLGVLNMESTERGSFTPSVCNMCQAFADQIAGNIHLAMVNRNLVETNRVVEERTRELAETNRKLKHANLELHRLSSYDALTGIPNRRRLSEVLTHEWRWARRNGRPLSFMLADLDHFKALNDTRGHLCGDDCLRQVAQVLADGLARPEDFVARYGGEEFALVLPNLELEPARAYAETLRARVAELALVHGASQVSPHVTVSIGVAATRVTRERNQEELVRAADAALYQAKNAGRNRVMVQELTA